MMVIRKAPDCNRMGYTHSTLLHCTNKKQSLTLLYCDENSGMFLSIKVTTTVTKLVVLALEEEGVSSLGEDGGVGGAESLASTFLRLE